MTHRLQHIGLAVLLLAPSALGSTLLPERPGLASSGELADSVILSFRGPVPQEVEPWLAAHGGGLVLRDDALHWVSARFPDRASAEAALAAARARPDVRAAEHDGYVAPAFAPDDPRFAEQWGLPAAHVPEAWDVTRGTHVVKVAILDTGIATTHPDLAANACGPFASFVPGEPSIADLQGHGTHVAGIAAAASDNGEGVAGVAQACLMGAKVLGTAGGQWSWVAAGIRWAVDNGAHIISMSLVGFPTPTIVGDAVAYAHARGVLLVASAGNAGCSPLLPANVYFPAFYNEVMAIGALAPPGDRAADLSSCGLQVELAAPGEAVLSTWKDGGYRTFSGTSMAAPFVAGVAALVKAQFPELGGPGLRCVLDLSADDLGAVAPEPGARTEGGELVTTVVQDLPTLREFPGRDHFTGFGRVNASRALDLAGQLVGAGLAPALDAGCLAAAPALGLGVPAAPSPVPLPV